MISRSLRAKDGFFFSSFHLPELVRCPCQIWEPEGWQGRLSFSVSISPNFLCLSLGTWTIEASYQSTPKQKFKAAFDVKEYGEKGVGGVGKMNMPGTGLERKGGFKGSLHCKPGPELGAKCWVLVFQPLGLGRATKEGAGLGGDEGAGTILRVPMAFFFFLPVLPSFEVQLVPNKTFFYLKDEVLGVDIHAR